MCKFSRIIFFIICSNGEFIFLLLYQKIRKTYFLIKSIHEKTEHKIDQKFGLIYEDHKKYEHEIIAIHKLLSKEDAQNLADNNCLDLYNVGLNVSTSYFLAKYNREVLCGIDTDGGGWRVIQQRQKVTKQVDFIRTWDSYKEGFGDLDTEFWIGNKFLHCITDQKSYELLVDVEDFKEEPYHATNSKFRVGNEESGHKLQVGGHEGNGIKGLSIHNKQKL